MLKGAIKKAFEGIKPSWKTLFLSDEIKPLINDAFKKLIARLTSLGVTEALVEKNGLDTYIRPGPEYILNAFRYCEVSDVKCIIVGQDPYPNADQAHGLSFSVPLDEKIPASLRKIYECLLNQDIIPEMPTHGNLARWARQGVLLLNRYLTRNPSIVKVNGEIIVKGDGGTSNDNMHPFWSKFTDAIVKHLAAKAEQEKKYLCLMLWGTKAQEMCGELSRYITGDIIDVQTWGHPSPLANMKAGPKNFINCNHFAHVNEELSARGLVPINWNPVKPAVKKRIAPSQKIVVFTDGGCSGNGAKHAKASYGVYFPKTFQTLPNVITSTLCGLVPSYELKLVDNKIISTDVAMQPSNNRGELLAVIYAFATIIENWKNNCPILLVLDSEYCMHIINERIWKWVNNSGLKKQANSDLLQILYVQLLKLKELYGDAPLLQPAAANHYTTKTPMDLSWPQLTVLHQRSHLEKHEKPKDSMGLELVAGNEAADASASAAL